MALKKEKKPKAEVETEDSILVGAAKAVGVAANPMPKKTSKKPKLAKHDKSGLPRKQKKAQQKAARAHQV